jgi:predicted ATPase
VVNLDSTHFVNELRLARDEVPSFDAYPFNLPAIRSLDTLALHPKVTFLVGENGAGKSTLIEAVAVALGLNAEGGSRNFRFSTRASHSDLHKYLVVRRGVSRPKDCFFLRSESYFNLATEIERLDGGPGGGPPIADSYGERPLHEQSHGESFFALFLNRFFGRGLYLLDEPEAALSPIRQMSFLTALHELVGGGSQFLIATHSPIIMAYPDSWIYRLDGEGARRVAYRETEHYKVTRDFLTRTDQMLSVLLEDSSNGQ